MHLTPQQLSIIRAYFAARPVKRAWLFGSYARGEADANSDVDLLVDLDESQKIGWEIALWPADLREQLGVSAVDLVPERSLYSNLRPFISQDQQLIYEK
jgi:uncharacterized protein